MGNILQSLPFSPAYTGCAHRHASYVSGMLAVFCIEFIRLLANPGDEESPSSSSSTSTSEEDGRETTAAVLESREDLKTPLDEGIHESMPGWEQTIRLVDSLMLVQETQLGGPPPPRMNSLDSFSDSMNFSGPQLLALLQGFTLQQHSTSSE